MVVNFCRHGFHFGEQLLRRHGILLFRAVGVDVVVVSGDAEAALLTAVVVSGVFRRRPIGGFGFVPVVFNDGRGGNRFVFNRSILRGFGDPFVRFFGFGRRVDDVVVLPRLFRRDLFGGVFLFFDRFLGLGLRAGVFGEFVEQPLVLVRDGIHQFFRGFFAVGAVDAERFRRNGRFAVFIVFGRAFVPRVELAAVLIIAQRIDRFALIVEQIRVRQSAGVVDVGHRLAVGAASLFRAHAAVAVVETGEPRAVFVDGHRLRDVAVVVVIRSGNQISVRVKAFVGDFDAFFLGRDDRFVFGDGFVFSVLFFLVFGGFGGQTRGVRVGGIVRHVFVFGVFDVFQPRFRAGVRLVVQTRRRRGRLFRTVRRVFQAFFKLFGKRRDVFVQSVGVHAGGNAFVKRRRHNGGHFFFHFFGGQTLTQKIQIHIAQTVEQLLRRFTRSVF